MTTPRLTRPPAGSSWTFARPTELVQCCWCGEPILPGDYAGRGRVKKRWPGDVRARRGLGIFCLHWRVATSEVWAESVPWILGARVTTHHEFGGVFRECVELVRETMEAQGWLPAQEAAA